MPEKRSIQRDRLMAVFWGIVLVGSFLSLACRTDSPTSITLVAPHIEGAELIGSDQCALCHGTTHESFDLTTHAELGFKNASSGLDMRCESCHGPGSLHFATGGNVAFIRNPKNEPGLCLDCHLEQAASFQLPGAHPVVRAKVNCIDCHNVHGEATMVNFTHGTSPHDQSCFECHQAQSGPFVFEHEAMREGCSTCHAPHGSVNDKMLVARNANLCLQCHQTIMSDSQVQIGGQAHTGQAFLTQGTCWTAGCHEAPHGSNVSPKLRF